MTVYYDHAPMGYGTPIIKIPARPSKEEWKEVIVKVEMQKEEQLRRNASWLVERLEKEKAENKK